MSVVFETKSGKNVLYEGAVLYKGERNYHDDSDYYALVWDESEGVGKIVEYDTTRYAGGGTAKVDATDEVREKYATYMFPKIKESVINSLVADATEVSKYKEVEVIRGRKLPIGTVGIVFWRGSTRYGESVGIELPNGERVFTSLINVEVNHPEEYLDYEKLEIVDDTVKGIDPIHAYRVLNKPAGLRVR